MKEIREEVVRRKIEESLEGIGGGGAK